MQIQINSDDHVSVRDELHREVQAMIDTTLGRFSERLTRIEVHLSDANAAKAGSTDKRCLMEARPAGREPVAVTHDAATVHAAYGGAARKLKRLLDSTLGRASDHKGAETIRKDGAVI